MTYDNFAKQTRRFNYADSEMSLQLRLPMNEYFEEKLTELTTNVEDSLRKILTEDLSFEGEKTNYATHNLHAFAAKFPPQLPRLFIEKLTIPGELVLDPMVGSGTTVVEALLLNRQSIGVDLDPLAILLARTKTAKLDLFEFFNTASSVLNEAKRNWSLDEIPALSRDYSSKAIEFFEYWFEAHTIKELHALVQSIHKVEEPIARSILQTIFSSTIITKSGGLSRARDLAHSRPHLDSKKVIKQSAFDAFQERLLIVMKQLETISGTLGSAYLLRGDARSLPLSNDLVKLIVTSPPYASNAIDYMRAHKFALMWFGYEPKELSDLRSRYIGSERHPPVENSPSETANRIIHELNRSDSERASVVAHYYREMEMSLREMRRVLAKGRAAIIVVGSSTIRGIDIEVPDVVGELAVAEGFKLVGVSKRLIQRNSRMMPVSYNSQRNGIEARMHEEGVIGLIKD